MIPGSEPILLDLEKLFLLSDSLKNQRVQSKSYAQNSILVIFVTRYLFTKRKIARNPEGFQVPGVVEMNPTGLPELFSQPRNQNNSQKYEQMRF